MVVFHPLTYMKDDLQKGIPTQIGMQGSGVARDKINVSSEMGGEGGSPQKLSKFFFNYGGSFNL